MTGMKRLAFVVVLAPACSKPQEKEATVKKEAPAFPTTTAGAVTGQTPGQMVDQAKQVAETTNANSAEKAAAMETDQ